MAEQYHHDYPELIVPPAASFSGSLELAGMEPREIALRLSALDSVVKTMVINTEMLADYDSPEKCFAIDVVQAMAVTHDDLKHPAVIACVNKATKIVRGEIAKNPEWAKVTIPEERATA